MSEIKDKTIKGVGWSGIDQVVNQGITFIVGLVLARLLTPDEYGLIGIITIFIAVFNIFITSGFGSALIRKKDATDQDYNTVFLFNIVVSAVLFVVLWFLAPLMARFFERPELVSLTRVMGVLLLINAVTLIQSTLLTKQINFKRQTKISIIASSVSGAVGIGMAFAGYGVWSLVGQQISRQGINSLLLWILSKWRPNFTFSKTSFKELWNFGWKLLCSSLLDTVWTQIYQVVIGKCYSPSTLGQFTRAQNFANLPSSNLTGVIQRVSYPVLSSVQDDKVKLKEGYRKIIKITMFVTFVCMLGMAAVAKPMIRVLIGSKWFPCVGFLQILCFSMMLYPLHALNLNMLQVQGRSDLFLKLEIIKKIMSVVPICLGIFYSIHAMLVASVITGFIAYYLNAYYSGRFLDYNIWAQVRDILPSFGIAIAMAVPVYLISFIPVSAFILLPLQVLVGASLVILICSLTRFPEYFELKDILLTEWGKLRNKYRK